ncbi:hypothetical protein [Haloglomus irregulare]|jgi:hypothetical protein|uniref:hypothetical protein n=1 Tax=Haloglomus irregulare TaxID=2234134 RepID=UPI00163D8959|nr:hypothetical protein [Haloglomus irregulare]
MTDRQDGSGVFHCGECGKEMNWVDHVRDATQPPNRQIECPDHGLTEPEEGWP